MKTANYNMKGKGYIPLVREDHPRQYNHTASQQYPPHPGYPTQEGTQYVPPPYYIPPQYQPYPPTTKAAPIMQQQSSNIVVVQSQPTPVVASTVMYRSCDHYLKLSITLTIIWLYLGNWSSLLCTIPAIILATIAINAHKQGDIEGAKFKGQVALILNIVSIVWCVIAVIIIIVTLSVITTSGSNSDYCYYYTYYFYDDYNDYEDYFTASYC